MSTITNHPSWLCELSREPVSEADCLACARQRLEPDCPFNPAILKALAEANAPDVGLSGLHQIGYPVLRVSGLVGCAASPGMGAHALPCWKRRRNTGPGCEAPSSMPPWNPWARVMWSGG